MTRIIDRIRRSSMWPELTWDEAAVQYRELQQSWGYRGAGVTLQSYGDLLSNGLLANSVVFGIECTRLGLFSEARFKYRSLIDKKIQGNTSLVILEQPWPNGTTADLLSRCLLDADAAGTSFTRMADDGTSLEQMRPDWVNVVSLMDEASGRKQVEAVLFQRDGVGDWEIYLAEDVVIWAPFPDPTSIWRGIPWLGTARGEIQNDYKMQRHVESQLDNAGTPNLVYKYPRKFVSEKARTELEEKLGTRLAGSENAGKTMILEDGADVEVVGASLQALQFVELSDSQRERIAAAAGMPAILAGITNANTSFGSDYGPAMRFFVDVSLRHLWRSLCGAFAQIVPVPAASELWFDTTDIAALQSGEKEAADVTQVQMAAISSAVMNGATYESAVAAVSANDITLLQSSGKTSVQLHPTTEAPPAADETPPA